MTDKELLEMAAKAAGIEILFWNYGHLGKSSRGTGFDVDGRIWNPLTDDGDALRLAVKLNLYLNCDMVLAGHPNLTKGVEFDGYPENDKYAATRRAIVRAAAEIGKTL